MTRLLPALPILLLAGCATAPSDHGRDFAFAGNGFDPAWFVSVRAGRIVLALGPPSREGPPPERYEFPLIPSRTSSGLRVWESAADGHRIRVEVRPEECRVGPGGGSKGVRVRFDDREFVGCGDYMDLVTG